MKRFLAWLKAQRRKHYVYQNIDMCQAILDKKRSASLDEYLNRKDVSLEHKFEYIMTTAISDALPDGQMASLDTTVAWTKELMSAVGVVSDNRTEQL